MRMKKRHKVAILLFIAMGIFGAISSIFGGCGGNKDVVGSGVEDGSGVATTTLAETISSSTMVTTTTNTTITTTTSIATTTTTLYIMTEIDRKFGNGGVVVSGYTAGGKGNTIGYSVKIDASGRILVAGESQNAAGTADLIIWRYNSDGSPDTTFGVNGVVIQNNIAGGNLEDLAWMLTLDSAGRIVVSGRSDGPDHKKMILCRYTENGQLDPTFGSGGIVVSDGPLGGTYISGYSLTIDARGRILVGGGGWNTRPTHDSDLVIWRYDENGVLDPTFGTGGMIEQHDTLGLNASERATCITTDSSGRILAAGYGVNPAGNSDVPIWRFNENGTLDPTFGSGGVVVRRSDAGGNGNDSAGAILVDAAGKILVAGASQNASGKYCLVIWKFNSDGTLDSTFGTSGLVIYDAPGDEAVAGGGMVIDRMGRLLICGGIGYMEEGRNEDLVIVRYHANGTLDNTFGTNGIFRYHNAAGGAGKDRGYSITVDSYDRIVVCGQGQNSSGHYSMVIWRIK